MIKNYLSGVSTLKLKLFKSWEELQGGFNHHTDPAGVSAFLGLYKLPYALNNELKDANELILLYYVNSDQVSEVRVNTWIQMHTEVINRCIRLTRLPYVGMWQAAPVWFLSSLSFRMPPQKLHSEVC